LTTLQGARTIGYAAAGHQGDQGGCGDRGTPPPASTGGWEILQKKLWAATDTPLLAPPPPSPQQPDAGWGQTVPSPPRQQRRHGRRPGSLKILAAYIPPAQSALALETWHNSLWAASALRGTFLADTYLARFEESLSAVRRLPPSFQPAPAWQCQVLLSGLPDDVRSLVRLNNRNDHHVDVQAALDRRRGSLVAAVVVEVLVVVCSDTGVCVH
jgi:hypothetical protein